MYANETLKESMAERSSDSSAELLQSSTPPATFLLKMNFKVGSQKMANAIAESVGTRTSTATTTTTTTTSQDIDIDIDIDDNNHSSLSQLKSLILGGMNEQPAKKGTEFRFDCTREGIEVAVNGQSQGTIRSPNLAKAFCNVYLDENTVSPTLKSSCLEYCQK